jgi:hypothetical protein
MYFIIKMSQGAMIAGVAVMAICCSASSAAMLMMGGTTTTTTPTTPAPVVEKYRYVRIIRDKDGDNHWMNLAEVEVFSGGTNVASGKTVTASSKYENSDQFPHANLVDGNKTNFAHTNNESVEWFLIDLGQDYDIEKVVITNRTDCCQDRLRNTKIQLSKAADMSSPKQSRAITTQEAPKATITWMPKSGAELTAA